MTRTILSWNSANWSLMRFIVYPSWFRLSSFDSCPDQVPILYRLSAVPEKNQATDSANWWQHAFCCEFASISTNANHYLSQSSTVAWLIFDSSSTPNLSLASGPVLSRDLFYNWASPEFRGLLTSAGFRLRRLSQIGIRLAFLHGIVDKLALSIYFTQGICKPQ